MSQAQANRQEDLERERQAQEQRKRETQAQGSQEQGPPPDGGDPAGDGPDDGLFTRFFDAVLSRKLDPDLLGQEKQSILGPHICNNFFCGDAPITMARTIVDSSIQSGAVRKAGGAAAADKAADPPDSPETLDSFLQTLYPDDSFFSFLTILFLRTVKERSLRQLSEQLQSKWESRLGPCRDEDAPAGRQLRSQAKLLSEVFAAVDTYIMDTNAGEVQVQCVHLADKTLEEQGPQWFWSLFPDCRIAALDWLFELTRRGDGFAARCARDAIKKCAAFSFYDFQELILPRLTSAPNADTPAWLADILREMLKDPALSANAAALLRHYASLDNNLLSITVLYLLDELAGSELEKRAAGLMEKALLGRLRDDQLKASVLITAVSMARRSERTYALLMESMRRASAAAAKPEERSSLEDAYLHLSIGDYLTAGRKQPELLLLDLREKPPREASLPLFLQCWAKPDAARFLTSVWDAYFEEAAKNGYPLEYTQVFWRRMAFQGSRTEFNRACFFLRDAERKHPRLAASFRSIREQIEHRADPSRKGIE